MADVLSRLVLLLNALRLALFSVAYGVMAALVGGTLNRLLVAEAGLPVTLVGFFLSIPLLTSPIRAWLGHYSDTHPLRGKRREPYLWGGALLAALGLVAVAVATARAPGGAGTGLLGALFLAFLVHGFGRNLGHNMFQALLAERFTGASKRYITLFEAATLIGSVMGAGAIGKLLETFQPARLVQVGLGVGVLVVVLAVAATAGQESWTTAATAERARQKDFIRAVRDVVLADPQARRFFLLVLFTFIGALAQDLLLEPFGALVLKMSVGQTTRLTAFWGIGVLTSMLLGGTFLLKWLGYLTVLRVGLLASMVMCAGLALTGASGNPGALRWLVLAMGLGTGLAGAGLLTGVMSFTTAMRAGLLMGVWGMANLLGRAAGSLMGGAVVDVLQALTGNPLVAYATVFGLEAGMLALALGLTFGLKIEEALAQREGVGEPMAQPAKLRRTGG